MSLPRFSAGRIRASLRGPTVTTMVANVAILASNAVAGVVSARSLGPAGRGQLAVVLLWSALISMVGGFGLSSACSYHIARWPRRQAALAAWLRRIAAQQAVVMTVVSSAVMWVLYLRLRLDQLLAVEYTAGAAAAAITFYGVCYAQGMGNFTRFNVIRVIPNAASAALMLAGAAALQLTPAEAGAAYLIPTCGSAVLASIWLYRATRATPAPPLSRRERRAMWSYGWRSLASFTGFTLNTNGDQLALGLVVPVGALGLYSVAASASAPLASLVSSLGIVGLPTVAALADQEKAAATWRIFRRAAYFLGFVSPALAILLPWAVPFVYGAHYSTAVVPAELLLIGSIFCALTIVVDNLLRAHDHPGFVSITQGAGGAVTIIGTVLLARHSLNDVALVSSVGYGTAFVLALVRLRMATLGAGKSVIPVADPGSGGGKHRRPGKARYRPGRHRRVARQQARLTAASWRRAGRSVPERMIPSPTRQPARPSTLAGPGLPACPAGSWSASARSRPPAQRR
jgi:O-antigen/teichoic acid export membrane protein